MDEDAIRAEMRLYALELVVSAHYATLHRQMPDPMISVEMLRQAMIIKSRNQTFRGLDASVSDHAAAELEIAIDRLAGMQKGFLTESPKTRG